MTTAQLAGVFDRPPLTFPAPDVAGMRVLVTGSEGWIGSRVVTRLAELGATVARCDLGVGRNVRSSGFHEWAKGIVAPDAVLHLAACKYATDAEDLPYSTALLNVGGTQAMSDLGIPFVLASTCKAADPCTAYGASKLIAERIARNAGGVVLRLVNVLGSAGSVVPIWDAVPHDEPLPVARCQRMFITEDEAVSALLACLELPSGTYGPNVPPPISMVELAVALHPGRRLEMVPPRRGDRIAERLVGEYESAIPHSDGLIEIVGPW